jgi:DnaK suppressor protein
MTNSRQTELKEMLEARRRAIEDQVHQKVREFRETATADATRAPADLSDDPSNETLDFALVEMQAQTLDNITAALARLDAGDYGTCVECEQDIPERRLRALPFAAKCLACQAHAEQIQRQTRRAGLRQAMDLSRQ